MAVKIKRMFPDFHFSLAATLRRVLRRFGFEAKPILADRSYGADTHCALVVRCEGWTYLVDPGYLLAEPIPLDSGVTREIATGFNRLRPVPRPGPRLELYTVIGGRLSLRLTFKTEPVDQARFIQVWDRSFGWDVMRDLMVTRATGDCSRSSA